MGGRRRAESGRVGRHDLGGQDARSLRRLVRGRGWQLSAEGGGSLAGREARRRGGCPVPVLRERLHVGGRRRVEKCPVGRTDRGGRHVRSVRQRVRGCSWQRCTAGGGSWAVRCAGVVSLRRLLSRLGWCPVPVLQESRVGGCLGRLTLVGSRRPSVGMERQLVSRRLRPCLDNSRMLPSWLGRCPMLAMVELGAGRWTVGGLGRLPHVGGW